MCYASSEGCSMPSPACSVSGGIEVCGPWAITLGYWIDGGRHGEDFYTCGSDWDCSEATVRSYLSRWVTTPDATCETYARTHVGGPYGADADYTLEYWYSVKDCLDYGLFTPPPLS
ncbi:hypothetical protein Pmani_030431 [Petrolisthes manimaculis]|uniref:lysozyme n=1 Tax=Petrolisthes manimaculis TaxID=1843537 RepID=A0AAE1NXV7_9EUCA|nr:hypothetical protein Pmani_030431 [Petrolisthes manimaculis]